MEQKRHVLTFADRFAASSHPVTKKIIYARQVCPQSCYRQAEQHIDFHSFRCVYEQIIDIKKNTCFIL